MSMLPLNPKLLDYLGQLGIGLMSAAKPGVDLFQGLGMGFQQANEIGRQQRLDQMNTELFNLKKRESESEIGERERKAKSDAAFLQAIGLMASPTARENFFGQERMNGPSQLQQSGYDQSTIGLMMSNPELAKSVIAARASREPPKSLAQIAAEAKAARETPEEAAAKAEATFPWDAARAAAGRSTVSVTTPFESEYSKARGKSQAEAINKMEEQAGAATENILKLQRLQGLLNQVDVRGATGPMVIQLKNIAKGLGMDVGDDVGYAQAADAIRNELALRIRNPDSGAGMPGAVSDRDLQFLTSMIAGVGNTPEGANLIIDASIRLEKRKQQIAREARKYEKAHGQLDEGWTDRLNEFVNDPGNDLFKEGDAGRLRGVSGGAVQPGSTGSSPITPEERGKGTRQNPMAIGPKDEEAFNALPSGAYYIGPDGKIRQKY